MYLIGCTYNFCLPHREFSQAPPCWPPVYASNGQWSGGSRLEGERAFGVSGWTRLPGWNRAVVAVLAPDRCPVSPSRNSLVDAHVSGLYLTHRCPNALV